jgi:hypothetical protein
MDDEKDFISAALVLYAHNMRAQNRLTEQMWIDAAEELELLQEDSEPLQQYADDAWLVRYYGDE